MARSWRRARRVRRPAVGLSLRGGVLVLIGVGLVPIGGLLSVPLLLDISALLLAAVLIGVIAVVLLPPRLDIRRSVESDVLSHGSTTTVTLDVRNRVALPSLPGRWLDAGPTRLTARAHGDWPGLGPSRGRRAAVTIRYRITGHRRGRHLVGPFMVRAVDPLGVAHRTWRHDATSTVVVLPNQVRLDGRGAVGHSENGTHGGGVSARGSGEDDVISRPYVAGDPLKRMDWKSTAQRGEFMVRQEEREGAPRAAVLLDTYGIDRVADRAVGAGMKLVDPQVDADLEWNVVMAASVLGHLRDRQVTTEIWLGPSCLGTVGERGDASLDDVLRAMAEVRARSDAAAPDGPVTEPTAIIVLGPIDHRRAQVWIDLVSQADVVHAFVPVTTEPQVLSQLLDAGWNVARRDHRDDQAAIWAGAHESRAHAQT